MRIDVISAVPELLMSPLEHSIVGRARAAGLLDVRIHDLRNWATDKHRKVDDYPFGGGAGMVLKPEPVFACLDELESDPDPDVHPPDEIIFMTPDAPVLTQSIANRLSLNRRMIVLAGHYKGLDQRVRDARVSLELSIGDYVLSGGELPALVLVDAVARLLPGVLGDAESALSDSFQDGLLDAPTWTRPAEYRGLKVPDVLLSGDHERIASWRDGERLKKTRERRPDLLDKDER